MGFNSGFKGLKAELSPICHLLALLGVHHFLHVSRIMVKEDKKSSILYNEVMLTGLVTYCVGTAC